MKAVPALKIAVIGTGALGSALLELLAATQFASVLLIDPDTLQERNLALSPFLQSAAASSRDTHSPKSPRPFKAELLAREARFTFNLHWQAQVLEIADVGWQILRAADLFVCCTDSTLSRCETAFIARMLRKPVLDGAVSGDGIASGRVSFFSPEPDAACYLCGMGEDRRAAVLGYAASASMGCRPPDDTPGMTGTVATLGRVAAMLFEAILMFSRGEDCHAGSTAVRTSLPTKAPFWTDEQVALTRGATCPWHESLPGLLHPLPWEIPLHDTLISLFGNSSSMEVQLAWPVCTAAVCAACGARPEPFERVAAVRRRRCPVCGLRLLQPLRAVHRLRASDPLGTRSPRQLHLPDRHLYHLCSFADMNGAVETPAS